MRRNVAIVVALVLIVVGRVVLVLACLLLAVMLGIGADEEEDNSPDHPKNNRPNVS